MPRKKKQELSFVEKMKRLNDATVNRNAPPNRNIENIEEIKDINERIKEILGLLVNVKKGNNMLFFVMYDIESDKVRKLVVKYLERKGCTRIQKSIFIANADTLTYNEIKEDLAEVQSAYDNSDSIIVLPISTDYLKMMKIIGKNINIDIITHSRNTLFF